MSRRVVTFNTNSSISPIQPNTQWKDDVRNNSTTDDEYRNARIERRNEYDNNIFNKYGNFGDGYGTQTWVNTNENKNDSSFNRSDPFFNPYHQETEKEILRNHNLTSSTGASRNDWRKFSDVGRGKTLDWSEVGEENNDSSDSRRNCSDSNVESCTISGGKKTHRKKYRKVRQIKRKTKRHRKTKKDYKKK